MKELKKESKAMNEWMDETERLVNSLSVNMDPKKATRVQDKINVSILRHLNISFQFNSSYPLCYELVFPGRLKLRHASRDH